MLILRQTRRYFATQFLKQNFAGRLSGQIEFSYKLESDWCQRYATTAIKFAEFTMMNCNGSSCVSQLLKEK